MTTKQITTMDKIYDDIATNIRKQIEESDHQLWFAIAGGPGSGKSTTAKEIAERLNMMVPDSCVVIPMDGFHYSKAKLKELNPPSGEDFLKRRGAPWTYDTDLCVELLCKAKKEKAGVFPTYDRSISDPIPEGTEILAAHKVVLVEGLYLLRKDDERWSPLDELWDGRWFVKAPSLEIQRQRLIDRSLQTWTHSNDEMWGVGEEGAAARVDANDHENMKLVAECENYADMVIETE